MKSILNFLIRAVSLILLVSAPCAHAATGQLDPLNLNLGSWNNFVMATAVQPDGKTIIAGRFSLVLGVPRNNIARLNADGTLDMGFDPRVGGDVYSVAVQADGKVVFGGAFSQLQPNGAVIPTVRNNIARVNADGTLDTGFNPNANGYVFSLAVQADGKVLFGGFFTSPRQYLARLNADGTPDAGFNPYINSYVFSVAVQTDGKLLLGGSFTWPRQYLERVNTDGTSDPTFSPATPNGSVSCVAVQADGKMLLGGNFTTPGQFIARLNSNGTLDSGFNANANNAVNSIAVQADGKVLFGGSFTAIQQTPCSRIARVNANGTLDTNFYSAANDDVYSVGIQADGTVLVGGDFTEIQSPGDRNCFARLGNDPSLQSLSVPDATQALWTRGGAGPEVGLVTFDLSTDGGTTWTPLGAGTRIGTSTNWNITGLSLSASGSVRATGRTVGGYLNGSTGLIQQVATFGFSSGAPDITVAVSGTPSSLTDGVSTVDFGVAAPGTSTAAKSFTITNPGTANLSGLAIRVDGANAGDFTVSAPSSTSVVPNSGSATFTVTFTPGGAGPRSAAIHIASNVAGAKNPFDIALTGSGNTPPTLTLPSSPVVAEATSATATVVNFTVTANDAQDGVLVPNVSKSSGSTFTLGDTTVTVSATDSAGATVSGSFIVRVMDTTAPVVAARAGVIAEATSAAGAAVAYAPAIATDAVGVTSLTYSLPSGTVFPIGTTTVVVWAGDAAGNTGIGYFTVTVRDSTPPVVTPPVNVIAEATSAGGAVVTYPAGTATDAVGVTWLWYSQWSGTAFSIGTTTVTMWAGDGSGNMGIGTFTVTVRDTTPPVVTPPTNVVVEATSAAGAVVNYAAASAMDAVGVASLTYSQASGTPFPMGTTTVSITAKDAANNTSTGTFTVTVQDTTPPVVAAHANVIAEATSAAGAVVNYAAGSATDAVGVTSLAYSQASGSIFPIGTTVVTIAATDAANNTGTGTFTVTVRDATPPVVTPPASITVAATSSSGAAVTFGAASATDAVGVVSVTYSQASGTTFPIGTTTVTVTARDAANNAGAGNFTVTVKPLTPLQSWREQHFGTMANTGMAAATADPYGIGIPNLAVFAFFGPNQNPNSACIAQLPQPQMSGGNLFYSFTQPSGVSGVTYGAQWSATMQNDWQPVADIGSGNQHIFSVPMGAGTNIFLRLTVTEQ